MANLEKGIRIGVMLRAAVVVVERDGWINLNHARVAAQSGCSTRTVYRWVRNRKQLRDLVLEYARARGHTRLLAEANALAI